MPNIKSAKKRVLVTETKSQNNRAAKTALKTQLKKFNAAVESGDGIQEAYKATVICLDKAVAKGILHKNTVARNKSAMAKKVNAAVK
ncbi:30S ribosomal protein S20 [Acidaminobacterium chupaoyuni]